MSDNILFIIPRTGHLTVAPPLGVGYLSSNLKKKGYKTSIIHCDLTGDDEKAVLLKTVQYCPAIVCISISTTSYAEAKKIIDILRPVLKNIPIIVGGPHVSALPTETMQDLNVDFAVFGEADESLPILIDRISGMESDYSDIKGICYKNCDSIVKTYPALLIKDLDKLPLPDWENINPNLYPKLPHQILFKEYPVAPVISSRGCLFKCVFCAVPNVAGQTLRLRKPEKVVDEIEFLVKNYGVKEIHFEDDSFTQNRDHALNICREILKRDINIVWSLPNGIRADTLDKELVEFMKSSGCYQIGLGIESGNNKVLDEVNKNIRLDQIKNAVDIIHAVGIEVRGFFMIGMPGETKREIEETLNLVKNLDIDFASFGICSPIPGSRYFQDYFKEVDYKDIIWSDISYSKGYKSQYLNAREMKYYLTKCVWTFYLKPVNLFRFLKALKFEQIVPAFRALKQYIL